MRKLFFIPVILLTLFPNTAFAATIKINEFYASGTSSSNPDWVEIYNDGIDISLYQLIDAANNKKDLTGATCNGNYCIIDWYNYLNNSGDTIKLVLKTAAESSLDQVIYGDNGDVSIPTTTQSAIRNPDYTGNWVISSILTKGTANNLSSPSPTPVETSSPSPSSDNIQSTDASSFTFSNVPTQINSDQSFSVSVNLSYPNSPNTKFYLKGAFKKADDSNYFGLTKVNGNWVKNVSSYTDQFSATTDSSGNWSGSLEVKPDSEDSGFSGKGDYIFKVGKYDSTKTNPSVSWSDNELIIKINSVEKEESNSTNTPSPTTKSTISPSSIKVTTSTIKSPKKLISLKTAAPQTASVAGITASIKSSTPSATPAQVNIKGQKGINPFIWVGLIFIFTGGLGIGYIYWKKKCNI